MKKVVKMLLEKETKGTYRYTEVGNEQVIGTLYLRKHAVPAGELPKEITLTIEG